MLEFNGTAIVIAISFIIFVILENFIFYRPMKKMLDEREGYITGNEDEANKNICAAKDLLDKKEKKISEAKGKSAQILNETALSVQEKFDNAIKEAKTSSNAQIDETKKQLEEEKINAQNALKQEIGTLSATIVSKILKKDVAMVNVNDELIEKALRGEL